MEITIGGRKYGLKYTVGAWIAYSEYVASGAAKSVVKAAMKKAILMSEAYCAENGGQPLTLEAISSMPAYVAQEILDAAAACEAADMERTVKSKKNGEGGRSG